MRTKVVLGIAAVCIAALGFVAGIATERNWRSLFAVAPPKLLEPKDKAVLSAKVHEFTWSAVPNAEKYYLYLAHSSLPDRPAISQELDVPMYPLATQSLAIDKAWTWKAKVQVNGRWSDWSEIRMFDVLQDK
jgi:hypothetical protein